MTQTKREITSKLAQRLSNPEVHQNFAVD